MSAIRLVTFDVTNTIIKVAGSVGHNYAQIAALYNVNVDPAQIDVAFRTNYKKYITTYPNFGVHNGLTTNKWWTLLVKDTFQTAGYDVTNIDSIAQHLYIHFASKQGWDVIPGAEQVLKQLSETGTAVGVISNFDERLERILAQLSLRHYFKFVLSSAVVKCAKPNSEIFQMALQSVNCRPEQGLHIGDNVQTDYEGATRAGMKALLYCPHSKPVPETVKEDAILGNLTDVFKFL